MKAQEYLGYKIRPVQETIRDTLDWWKQNLPLLKNSRKKG
jgi:nucleoside-diphosphate-sugar epimerase